LILFVSEGVFGSSVAFLLEAGKDSVSGKVAQVALHLLLSLIGPIVRFLCLDAGPMSAPQLLTQLLETTMISQKSRFCRLVVVDVFASRLCGGSQ
jgi:hypothetical protein